MTGEDALDRLTDEAIALADKAPRAVLGIAGSPGSGKSTLVECLLTRIAARMGPGWAAHVPMDGFHLADSQLNRLGALDRKGAPETFDPAGYAHLLERIREETQNEVYVPGFDRDLEQPLAAALVVLPGARLVLTEGNYLLLGGEHWTRARLAMDRVWFVDSDEPLRLHRLVARHVEFGKPANAARAWVAEVDQRNAELVSPTADAADRVILNGAGGWRLRSDVAQDWA